MEKVQVSLGGAKFDVRKWPLRPGWKIANRIMTLGGDVMGVLTNVLEGDEVDLRKIDFCRFASVINDENLDLVLDILVEGLVFKDRDKARAVVEDCSFEEVITALEPVLMHNVSFLAARLVKLQRSKETSSPPAQS